MARFRWAVGEERVLDWRQSCLIDATFSSTTLCLYHAARNHLQEDAAKTLEVCYYGLSVVIFAHCLGWFTVSGDFRIAVLTNSQPGTARMRFTVWACNRLLLMLLSIDLFPVAVNFAIHAWHEFPLH